jgi:hypothetical protein
MELCERSEAERDRRSDDDDEEEKQSESIFASTSLVLLCAQRIFRPFGVG